MKTKKELREYADLYGWDITLICLKEMNYKFVSFTEKSIPSPGSPCWDISKLKPSGDFSISKVILHKDNSVTLKTSEGNLRFWN